MPVSLKITHCATTRRLTIETSTTFTELQDTLSELFPWPLQINYIDNENGFVQLNSQRELEEFFRVAMTINPSPVRMFLTAPHEETVGAGGYAVIGADFTNFAVAVPGGFSRAMESVPVHNSNAEGENGRDESQMESVMEITKHAVRKALRDLFLNLTLAPTDDADLERRNDVNRRVGDVSEGTKEAFNEFVDVVIKGNELGGTIDAVRAVWPMLMEWVKEELGKGEVGEEKVNGLISGVQGKIVSGRMMSGDVLEGLEGLFRCALEDEGVVGLLRAVRDVNEIEGGGRATSA